MDEESTKAALQAFRADFDSQTRHAQGKTMCLNDRFAHAAERIKPWLQVKNR